MVFVSRRPAGSSSSSSATTHTCDQPAPRADGPSVPKPILGLEWARQQPTPSAPPGKAADPREKLHKTQKKTGVALLIRHRGHCELLWAVVPPLQVVLSSACSVASLGRFPSHYLPGRPRLRRGVLADHLFGWGIPSTRQAGHVTVHSASSVKSPCGAQGGMTLPNEVACCHRRS